MNKVFDIWHHVLLELSWLKRLQRTILIFEVAGLVVGVSGWMNRGEELHFPTHLLSVYSASQCPVVPIVSLYFIEEKYLLCLI